MLAVSAGFLQAIKNKAPQDVRLEFANGDVINTSDISITSGGLTYTEILNGETDVIFGRAVMSELSAVLVNADGRFADFDFSREFTAKVGVFAETSGAQIAQSGKGVMWNDDNNYTLSYEVYSKTQIRYNRKTPSSSYFQTLYLTCNNAVSLIIYGDNLYAIGADYQIITAWQRTSYTSHKTITVPEDYPAGVSAAQVREWVDSGTSVRLVDGVVSAFEYVPLGVFKGERPEKVRGKLINFTAHDRMSLFDKPAEAFAAGLTFPCTLGQIYTKLCDFCGVGCVSAEFPNSGKTFDANPLEDTDYTCREILGYIAEAAGSYARMSRDGAVELVWFAPADYTATRTDRFEMTESEFLTPPIDRLEVYNSYGDQLNTSGTGDIVYGISDNPFLYIENDTQLSGLQPSVDTIYSRITSLPSYHPSSFRAEFNPAVQCGDIISVVDDYGETIRFPVFVQTITWNGFGKTTYENTGGVIRQNAPFTQRELEQIKKKSVKTKDLWTYVDSYLASPEGVASINAAVGGNFATKDDLTGFVTETQLNVAVEAYINGEEGIASLTQSLSGTFVTIEDYDNNITLTATSQMFVHAEGADGYAPSSITLTANTAGKLTFQWYRDDTLLSGKTSNTLTVTPSDISETSATYKVVGTDISGNTYSDQMTIAKLREGAPGLPGEPGKNGKDGADGYTILLSNEYIEIAVDADRIPETSGVTVYCYVDVYRGTTKLTAIQQSGTPTESQYKVSTEDVYNGLTLTQDQPGIFALSYSNANSIPDFAEYWLTITLGGGLTLSGKITVTANMNGIASSAYKVTSKIDVVVGEYIENNKGTILAGLTGEFVTQDDLEGLVTETELNTSIKQYISGEEGVAAITSAVSGKFMAAPLTVSYSTPSGVTYGFEKTSDGYYTSTNAGISSSFSYGQFTFTNNSGKAQEITLRCISSGENNCDYGIVSTINNDLPKNNNGATAASATVLKTFYGVVTASGATADVKVTIPAGISTITFKFRKDGGVDKGDDCFKILPIVGGYITETDASSLIEQRVDAFGASLKLSVSNGAKSSTISLTKDGVSLSSQTIQFTGDVVFKSDLSTAGSTTINGANIMTGTLSADVVNTAQLKVQNVWYNDPDAGYFSVMSSEISGTAKSTVTRVGPKDIRNDYLQALELYGSAIYLVRAGKTASHSSSLLFDMENEEIIPAGDDVWYIGTENNSFNRIYLDTGVYLRDQNTGKWTRLYADGNTLYWKDGTGEKYVIV